MPTSTRSSSPATALIAAALAAPFAVLLVIGAFKLQPMEAWLRHATTTSDGGLNLLGSILIGGSLLLLPVALLLALSPLAGRHHRLGRLNLAVALGVAVLTAPVLFAVGEEYVLCEVEQVANCD